MVDEERDETAQARVDDFASVYEARKDFDYFNTKLASQIICPECRDKDVLEVGTGMGEMAEDLLAVSKSLTIVEPATRYAEAASRRWGARVEIHNVFLEELTTDRTFQVVVLACLLHHLPNPQQGLEVVKKVLAPGGLVLATVPNSLSLHRQIGVRAGLLTNELADSERNVRFHQFHKFTKASFRKVFDDAGFKILDNYAFMLKPFSSEQMQSLNLSWPVIEALNQVGKENEHLASQLFIKAAVR